MREAMRCPCQSNQPFEQCCQPIILGHKKALTAEQLMRSRYSAYAVANGEYILKTYSVESAQQQHLHDIQQWAEQCQWVNLIIHYSDHNTVEFSAFFIEDNQLCILREKSKFIFESVNGIEQWFYHNGEIIENAVLNKVKRNDPCPCQQHKKFKQCCGRLLN